MDTSGVNIILLSKGVCSILVRGVNAPLPPEVKKILKIFLQNGAIIITII